MAGRVLTRVIYVDDEEYLLEVAKDFLESLGEIKVDTATSVDEAMCSLANTPYDCVISDYQMPIKNGLDLLAKVRSEYGDLPFILFTGRGRESVVIEALALGANFYIQKGGDPIAQFAELNHKIRSAVDKHQMQLRMARKEALMEEAERMANMGSWSYDYQSREISISPQMRLILDLPPMETVSLQDLFQTLGNEASASFISAIASAKESGRATLSHDFQLKNKEGKLRYYKAHVMISYGNDGKPVTLTGVGQDISGLMATKEKLEENARLNALLDTIDDIVIVAEKNGNVLRVNRVGIDFLRMPEAWIIGKNIDGLVSAMDGSSFSLMGLEADHRLGKVVRLRFRSPEGEELFAEVRRSSGKWDGREVLIFVARDIRENLRIEQALKESEENFRTFFESMSDLIFVSTPDGRMMYCNESVSRKLGYGREELAEMHILNLHPKDKRREAEDIFTAMFQGERDSCPLPLARKDGTLLPVDTRVWFGRWGGKDCIFGISYDLSAEAEAQQRFERLFRNNPAPMALSTLPDRAYFDVNDAFSSVFGYTRKEAVGRTSKELGLFVNPEAHEEIASDLLQQRRVSERELQVRRKDGGVVDGLFSGEVISNQGKEYFLTVMTDITARKAAQEELQRLAERLSLATRAGGVGIWDFDGFSCEVKWDAQMYKLYGISEEEFSGTNQDFVTRVVPEEQSRVEREIQMALDGEKEFDTEFHVLWPDGTVRAIRALATVQRDASGRPTRAVGTNWDITRQEMSESLNKQLMSTITSGVAIIDPLTRRIEIVNTAAAGMFGTSPEKIVGKRCHSFLCPAQEGKCPICDLHNEIDDAERVMLRADGSKIPILKTVKWIEIGGRKKLLECFIDITERKRVEEMAMHQSAMLNSLLDSMPDMVFFKDLDGVYLGCNPAFAALLGLSPKDIIGRTDYDLFSAEIADSLRDNDWKIIQERHSRRFSELLATSKGKSKSIDTMKTPYWGPDGKLVGMLGVSRETNNGDPQKTPIK